MPKLYKAIDKSHGHFTGYIVKDDGKQKRFLMLGRSDYQATFYAMKQVSDGKLFSDRPIMETYAIRPTLIAEW